VGGTFIVTAATFQKEHYFARRGDLQFLHDALLTMAAEYEWQMEAWAVFSNHYHFIARSPTLGGSGSAESLRAMLSQLHTATAKRVNTHDGQPGRKVWHNFWETGLTMHNSYMARLHYVHENAVKHGLVAEAVHYPWCSAGWLEKTTPAAKRRTLARFGTQRVQVRDDFEPVPVVD
jgi:putative transposase